MAEKYLSTPNDGSRIVTRRVPFDFPDDLHPHWTPHSPEFAQMWNGLSLTMPYLEPYLIRTMREGMKKVKNPATLADAAGFMAQEGQHYQMHQRFNTVLKMTYPELQTIEDEMTQYYKKLSKKSLKRKLAYSAGFESMTLGATRFIIGERRSLFAGADTRVASFWIWHMTGGDRAQDGRFRCLSRGLRQLLCACFWRFSWDLGGVLSGHESGDLDAQEGRPVEELAYTLAPVEGGGQVRPLCGAVFVAFHPAGSQPKVRGGP